jgi:hypothetical protein
MVSLRIGFGREEPLAEVVERTVGVRSVGPVPTKLRFLLTPARKYGLDVLWITRLTERYVWSALEEKFRKYKDLANKLDIPYIVGFAVELVGTALSEPKDVLDAVHSAEYGLFRKYPEVSGLYHFADSNGYHMWYEPNPYALRPLENMLQGSPIRAWD